MGIFPPGLDLTPEGMLRYKWSGREGGVVAFLGREDSESGELEFSSLLIFF